ncbi:uncharacterized protein CMC5_071070 [Chondromyces crocatus]|uniref:Uncharacterized protein n=1 Tax=Chondromyces crocatus TaxID=52 RepID=A0A0K1EPY6_CHOCO|nr:uncharacterized protein CMC5_071070 [Chondromyces crocatus]
MTSPGVHGPHGSTGQSASVAQAMPSLGGGGDGGLGGGGSADTVWLVDVVLAARPAVSCGAWGWSLHATGLQIMSAR